MLNTIDYARPDTASIPQSRIIVRQVGKILQFVDPPIRSKSAASAVLLQRSIFGAALQILLAVTIVTVLSVTWSLSRGQSIGLVAITISAELLSLGHWFRRSRRNPTVIEIGDNAIVLIRPGRNAITIPIRSIDDVSARKPHHIFGFPGQSSSLLVRSGRRTIRLLPYRQYAEVIWLARLLRLALKMPESQMSETARMYTGDNQIFDQDAVPFELPSPTRRENLKRSQMKERFRHLGHTVDVGYNDLGMIGFLFLASLVISGVYCVANGVDAILICMHLGRKAYFHDGVHAIPHHGFFKLSNGTTLDGLYPLLFFFLFVVGMVLCVALALGLTISLNIVYMAYRRFRTRIQK